MEAVARGPYQGVLNIVRFNWHFYVIAGGLVVILIFGASAFHGLIRLGCILVSAGVMISVVVSLLASHYIYDRSGLYDLSWVKELDNTTAGVILNVHAGFDETSRILKKHFPTADLRVFDFYDPSRHTEVSIERARKAYPPYDGTIRTTTSKLPLADKSASIVFNIFALHEVRNKRERIAFLTEQLRVLANGGKVVVVEHLRDAPNFLAYNIGFFHFLSEKEWIANFQMAGLAVDRKFKITPLVTVFTLRKS